MMSLSDNVPVKIQNALLKKRVATNPANLDYQAELVFIKEELVKIGRMQIGDKQRINRMDEADFERELKAELDRMDE